jgi:uncharacterized damage-inducible protein DinB
VQACLKEEELQMEEPTLDREAILAQYAEGPALLREAIAGLSGEGLDAAPDAENWSIRQIAHHIVDGDHLWAIGIKAALGDCDAAFGFPWYWAMPQMQWSKRWAYAERDLEPSLALFEASRRQVIQLLEAMPDAWDRALVVQFPNREPQRLTVGQIVEGQAGHVVGHVEDIHKIRKERGL